MSASSNTVISTNVNEAVEVLQQGGVIAYPTEAVWGVGCDPANTAALEKLMALKARDPNKGVILIAASVAQVQPLMEAITPEQQAMLDETWPGPNTWLVPPSEQVHPLVKGQHPLVAVRVTDHPLVKQLCQAFGGAIVSTSANPAGEPPAMSEQDIVSYFPAQLDFVLSGELGGAKQPSRIRNLLTGETLR